jgi:hypothetical protein
MRHERVSIMAAASAMTIASLVFEARHPGRRLGAGLGIGAVALMMLWSFPETPNHWYLLGASIVLVGAPRLCQSTDAGRYTFLLRALGASVVFGSGAQKVMYGCYDHGEFLAVKVATAEERFGPFSALVSAAEREELRSLATPSVVVGGPFEIRSFWPLLASRVTVTLELLLPVLMRGGRFRTPATGMALGFLVAIQVLAREVTFALAMTCILSLFFAPRTQRRLLLGVGVASITLGLVRLSRDAANVLVN